MKLRTKLLIFLSSLALSSPAAFANIFRVNLTNYTFNDPTSNVEGTLEGFFVVDTSLINNDPTFSNTAIVGPVDIPDWITSASLTFTRTGGEAAGSPSVTKTKTSVLLPLDEMNWRVKQSTIENGGLDFNQEFVSQMTTFALSNGAEFGPNPGAAQDPEDYRVQQVHSSEALLEAPISSTPVPGPLPLLGIGPLAWYYKKFKKKSIKIN